MTLSAFSSKAHFQLGMWLRNNWGLWSCSRLRMYFAQRKIDHPDDMSGMILDYYYQHLTGNPTTLNKLIRLQEKRRRKNRIRAKANKGKIFSEYQSGDTVIFSFRHEFITPEQKKKHEINDCEAQGIVLKKNRKKEKLLIELISSCDPLGIITEEDYEDKKKQVRRIIWKGLMKVGERRWLNYKDWEVL